MKRIFLLMISVFMLFMFTNVSFAKDYDKGRGNDRGHQDRDGDDDKGRGHGSGHQDRGGDDYRNYSGYRSTSRHDNYTHEHFNNYRYNGHWNSWNSWEQYKRSHPNYERHGHYERYNNQLFFMFNDGVNAFSFSIGR
jgi:hypothetical protein